MKVLKGRLHIQFGDLMPGDTFVFDGSPYMRVGGSGGSNKKIVLANINKDINYLNGVNLETGVVYHYPKDKKIEKVDLGVTGMDLIEE